MGENELEILESVEQVEEEVILDDEIPEAEAEPEVSMLPDETFEIVDSYPVMETVSSGMFPSSIDVTIHDETTDEIMTLDEDYGIQVTAVNPITSASGLKGVLLDVLGDYDAIVVEYRYLNNNSTSYSYVREIQPDYPWLCSAGIFLALLWSIFTVGGRMICRK